MKERALKLIQIAKDKQLTTLNLGRCGLRELPDELFELTWLEELIISDIYHEYNYEKKKWDSIGRDFKGEKNHIATLPSSLTKLVNLKKLAIGESTWKNKGKVENKLEDISLLSELKNLTFLSLEDNEITDLRPLSTLSKLTELIIPSNNISDLSPLSRLSNLKVLVIFGNKINDISPLANLSLLTNVLASNNNITDLTPLASLSNLVSISLNRNNIFDVEPLSKLLNLDSVNLGDNQITNLKPLKSLISEKFPFVLNRHISSRSGISVENNPLEHPPIHVIEQGGQAVLTYFNDLERQGTGKLNEAKLIIVGEPESGKSTLMETLFDYNYLPPETSASTLGIEVREGWQFPHPKRNGAMFSANIWDFGGQQIQYMTHQFFLTSGAVYVLVSANDRKEATNFPYWFKIIHLLGESRGVYSPVLVVLNEKNDEHKFTFDRKFFEERYPELQIDVCQVDLLNRNGKFETMNETIKSMLTELPHVNDERPAKWNDIRTSLRDIAKERAHISFGEYASICKEHDVNDESSQKVLSGYLHRIGSLLHFVDDVFLRDFIILQPQWAVDAVYSVLIDIEVSNADGKFKQEKLDSIWDKYSVAERRNLLNLMKQENFEICYELENEKGTFIAPQLLNAKRPFYEWTDVKLLKFRFQYKFMPEGIITRLIVRLSHLISKNDDIDLVWNKGLVLESNNCSAQIMEEENRDGLKVIDIAITGDINERKYLLHTIREEIERIHTKWFKNIESFQMIPCTCEYCIDSQHKDLKFFEFNALKRARRHGKTTVECDREYLDVSIQSLLEGVYEASEIEESIDCDDEYKSKPDINIHIDTLERAIIEVPLELQDKPIKEEKFYKEHWFISLVSALIFGGLFYIWSLSFPITVIGGVIVGYVVYALNYKRRYWRASMIAFSWVVLNALSSSIVSATGITEESNFSFLLKFNTTTNSIITVGAFCLIILWSFLDFKQENKK